MSTSKPDRKDQQPLASDRALAPADSRPADPEEPALGRPSSVPGEDHRPDVHGYSLAPAFEFEDGEAPAEPAVTMGRDGRLVRAETTVPAAEEESLSAPLEIEALAMPLAAPPPAPARTESGGRLELDESALSHAFPEVKAEPAAEAAALRRARRSHRGPLLALLGAIALVAVIGGLVAASRRTESGLRGALGELRDELPYALRSATQARPGTLWIDSDPSGADVYFGNELLGQTPYIADNTWPAGPRQVRLSKTGYEPATATFPGAEAHQVRVQLRRRQPAVKPGR